MPGHPLCFDGLAALTEIKTTSSSPQKRADWLALASRPTNQLLSCVARSTKLRPKPKARFSEHTIEEDAAATTRLREAARLTTATPRRSSQPSCWSAVAAETTTTSQLSSHQLASVHDSLESLPSTTDDLSVCGRPVVYPPKWIHPATTRPKRLAESKCFAHNEAQVLSTGDTLNRSS